MQLFLLLHYALFLMNILHQCVEYSSGRLLYFPICNNNSKTALPSPKWDNMEKTTTIKRTSFLFISITGISLLHYFTPLSLPMLHDIFQRLYYIPIILAAFWFGLRGGLACAFLVSVAYTPHILFQWGGRLTIDMEKYLELVLYNVVGGITGFLSEQEETRRKQLEDTAQGLEKSLLKQHRQAELIIKIEEQLRRAERLSTIGELAAVLAHEIRNPLGSIKGTAEILKDDFSPGDKKYEFLEILIKESNRLNRVVEDFLRLAKPQPLITGSCDIMEELHNILTLVEAEANRRGIQLVLQPAQLPQIQGDPEKLRQAFLNIALNALQATPDSGAVTITASQAKADKGKHAWINVCFSDTGPGLPPAAHEQIFEPFYTTKEEGAGLGLAIAKKIVEGHGGRIEVESAPGRGATFCIRLPQITKEEEHGTNDPDH